MKSTQTLLVLLLFLVVFSCKNKHQKTNAEDTISVSKIFPETDESFSNDNDSIQHNELKVEACDTLIKEILITSSRFKQITKGLTEAVIKNGGTGYGVSLNVTENSSANGSVKATKIYNFTLYEIYPDRQMNSARFTFDLNKKQLFEYDVVEDTMKLIEFNKELLVRIDSGCK